MIRILIPLCEARRFDHLEQTIRSILTQSYRDFQLSVCADRSDADSIRRLETLSNGHPGMRVVPVDHPKSLPMLSLTHAFLESTRECTRYMWLFPGTVLSPTGLQQMAEMANHAELCCPSGWEAMHGSGMLFTKRLVDSIGWLDTAILLRQIAVREFVERALRKFPLKDIPEGVLTSLPDAIPLSVVPTSDTLQLLRAFTHYRDWDGWPLDPVSALALPLDRIPSGMWTSAQLIDLFSLLITYFSETGDHAKQREWTERLDALEATQAEQQPPTNMTSPGSSGEFTQRSRTSGPTPISPPDSAADTFDATSSIYQICQAFSEHGPVNDSARTASVFMLAYLARKRRVRSFLQLATTNESHFVPTAVVVSQHDGHSYRLAPRSAQISEIFAERESASSGFGELVHLIHDPVEPTLRFFAEHAFLFDLLHVEPVATRQSADSTTTLQALERLYPMLDTHACVVLEAPRADSSREARVFLEAHCTTVFECDAFSVFLNSPDRIGTRVERSKLAKRIAAILPRVQTRSDSERTIPTVAVGVLTYNQLPYIEQCVRSVLNQVGDFQLRVVICDDCSTDGTSELIRAILAEHRDSDRLLVQYERNPRNLGIIKNFGALVDRLKQSDFFTICEGDDYYLFPERIERHLEYHRRHPEVVLSFNQIVLKSEFDGSYKMFVPELRDQLASTESLAAENYIGNLSSCFYNSLVLRQLSPALFESACYDWYFNLTVSEFGDIGALDEPLSVYRKHRDGAWSGLASDVASRKLVALIDRYNAELDFLYDEEFTSYRNRIMKRSYEPEPLDLLIVDDAFPHPISGFRFQEYVSILAAFPRSRILLTGEAVPFLGTETSEELLIDFKQRYPQFGNQVQRMNELNGLSCRLLYGIFLGNAYHRLVDIAEEHRIPFAFTLYPGGRFGLQNAESDRMLQRVCTSPYFRGVIVTQPVTADYLRSLGFCKAEQIIEIPGVVVPLEKLSLALAGKRHFGYEKSRLDVCFVAHKYTPTGEDKGYDVFVEVARRLSRSTMNLSFHVVGPFDRRTLPVDDIPGFRFYGTQPQAWFDEFYLDKDILLSPNICGKIYPGSFDGFPTACATDASLREVAVFCTDPLGLNQGRFCEKTELCVLPHAVSSFCDAVTEYYSNPKALRDLAIAGRARTQVLYSEERQILPRLKLIRELLGAEGVQL